MLTNPSALVGAFSMIVKTDCETSLVQLHRLIVNSTNWHWADVDVIFIFIYPLSPSLSLHLVTSTSCNHDNITKRITNWWANIFWVTYAQESRYICFIQYSILIFLGVNDMICPNYIISRENWNWWMWASINLIWLMLSEPQHIQCSIMFSSRNSHFRTFLGQGMSFAFVCLG